MPKYSVRLFKTYTDEFEIEAASEFEAIALAEKYEYMVELPEETAEIFEAEDGKVQRLLTHEYHDSDHPCVNELDADGNYLE